MKALLKIHSNPISTNSAYYKRNRSFNENARTWRANFLKQLQNDYNQAQIARLTPFNPSKHCLHVVFTWLQPRDILFRKDGQISLKSMDVDNCLKIPTDLVFDAKYNDKWLDLRKYAEKSLYKDIKRLTNVNINDKFITSITSIKAPSIDGTFHCFVEISIQDLPK